MSKLHDRRTTQAKPVELKNLLLVVIGYTKDNNTLNYYSGIPWSGLLWCLPCRSEDRVPRSNIIYSLHDCIDHFAVISIEAFTRIAGKDYKMLYKHRMFDMAQLNPQNIERSENMLSLWFNRTNLFISLGIFLKFWYGITVSPGC